MDMTPEVYCTTYCNQGHRLDNGKPVGHACYIIPPAALAFERAGQTLEAITVIMEAEPLRYHRGLKP